MARGSENPITYSPLMRIAALYDIHGNLPALEAVLEDVRRAAADEVVPHRAAMRWVAERLGPEERRELAGWPGSVRAEVDGPGRVLFCHATPRSDSEIFTRSTPEERLLPIFSGLDAALVVCGHTHMQFDRTVGGVRVVNAGSVGMPFGEPGAYWLLLGPDVRLRRSSYDLGAAAARIRATEYPQALDFAERNVLEPPSERQALERFARAELE